MKSYPYFSPDEGSGSPSDSTVYQVPTQLTPDPAKVTSAPTPDNDTWEKKYKGLQTVVNKQVDEIKIITGDRDKAYGDLESLKLALSTSEDKVKVLTDQFNGSNETVQANTKSLSAKDIEIGRLRLLINEFPALASFENKNVLPTAETVEELRTKFQGFQEAMKDVIKINTHQILSNSAPPSGGGSASSDTVGDQTLESLQTQLDKLAGKRDQPSRDEYLRLRDLYDKAWDARHTK